MKRLAILGGGITGLTLAFLLQEKFKVTLYEKSHRLGGWIETKEVEGFDFEMGPRGFRPYGEGWATMELLNKLQLTPLPPNASAKKRFVLHRGRLRSFGFPYLFQCGLFSSIIKDLCVSKAPQNDENLEHFFLRHLHPKMVEGVIDPVVKGIFAGELSELSMDSCFPLLKKIEKERGSLILGRSKNKKSALPPLYSFVGGMERLPKEIVSKLTCNMHTQEAVQELSKGLSVNGTSYDLVISTLPMPVTGQLVGMPFPLSMKSLTTVSVGWNQAQLPIKGFGYLVPTKENRPYLGMTWDSHIFHQPGQESKAQGCLMIEGTPSHDECHKILDQALKQDLKMRAPPDVIWIQSNKNAIAQFPIGHRAKVQTWRERLPKGLYVCGSSVEGKGVNGCILQAMQLAQKLNPCADNYI